jgi:uncharacterized FAD-dependent dehydrogenase
MENKHKIIFIGAGVANLVAANRLLDYSIKDFIIIEQGESIENRYCDGEELFSCKKCQKGCSTLEGVGGANANHGNKLCYFPASDKITESFSQKEIDIALKFLSDIASPYFDICFNSKKNQLQKNRKYYNSDVLNKDDFKNFIITLSKRLKNKILTNTKVVDIEQNQSGFEIITNEGDSFNCDKLILGTGRSSYKFIKNQLDKLGIKYHYQTQDIGIRIEALKESFTNDYYYQIDPKFKFEWQNLGSARTFCAHNQGKVVPVNFGKSFFADGAFDKTFGTSNNIALMVRTQKPLTDEEIEEWCKEINVYANNSLVLGKVNLSQDSSKLVSDILALIPKFPTPNHKKLMNFLLQEIINGDSPILKKGLKQPTYLTIYAPAIDRQWVVPQLTYDFSTKSSKNLYILGDAAGKSRGFIQAMFSGAIWADRLNYFTNSQTKVEWLNLV